MKLKTLFDHAFDETWIKVKVKDGDETHFFWSADYIGAHPDVMPELEPLLGRTFDEFWLEYGRDPENPKMRTAMLCVELNERRKRR